MHRNIIFSLVIFILFPFLALATEERMSVETLLSAVSREVRKNDPWVESVLESNYSTPTTTPASAKVQIRMISEQTQEKLREFGLIANNAAYSPEWNHLLIPSNPSNPTDTIGAITHELWHAAYDADGIIHSKAFTGPSDTEIITYANAKVQSPEFDKLRKKMDDWKKLQKATQKIGVESRQLLTRFTVGFETLKSLQADHLTTAAAEAVRGYLPKKCINTYRVKRKKLNTALYQELLKFKKHKDSIIKNAQDLMTTVHAFGTVIHQMSSPVNALVAKIERFNNSVRSKFEVAIRRKESDELRALEQEIKSAKDPRDRRELEELRTLLTSSIVIQGENDFLRVFAPARIAEFTGGFDIMRIVMAKKTNIRWIVEILENPNEVMARVVASCYGLHFEPVSQSLFHLREADLQFLERFRYQNKLMFRKGVEKYRMGLRMIAEGAKPEEVKELLEYATAFEYKGVKYLWPESRFELKGIPPDDRHY